MKRYFDSPIGWLELESNDEALTSLRFQDTEPRIGDNPKNEVTEQAVTQLEEYFEGSRTRFTVSLSPEGSDFQQQVWDTLREIPYGQTISYSRLAQKLGDINKVRAVGSANGKNPIPIIIPCHRVIGADNSLVGYAGGIERKHYLLKHEGAILL